MLLLVVMLLGILTIGSAVVVVGMYLIDHGWKNELSMWESNHYTSWYV